jgi:hypothetical protein
MITSMRRHLHGWRESISREAPMKSTTRLYAWLKLLAVLHIVEQMIFGMPDLYELQHLISIYESWFANTTTATAVLVTIVMAFAALGARCIISGGFARFMTMFVLGLPTIGELHHVIETVRARCYTAGTVTAVPYVICGVLFLRALLKENRPPKTAGVEARLELRVAA